MQKTQTLKAIDQLTNYTNIKSYTQFKLSSLFGTDTLIN